MKEAEHQYPLCEKETAIKNLGGLVWLYEKQFSRFKTEYADSSSKVYDYLLCNKPGEARILIHSVKGLAGTLGLHQLYYAAAKLEQSIISSDASLKTDLILYDQCLKDVITLPEKD